MIVSLGIGECITTHRCTIGLPAGALGTVRIFRSKGRGIKDQWLPIPSQTRIRNVEQKSTDSPKANTKIDVVNPMTTLL